MIVIGICGGVASGKSLVARELEGLGAAWIDADRIGHEVLEEEQIKTAIRRRWGDGVFTDEGDVNRRALAERVFAPPPDGPPQLRELEEITHPRITRKITERLEQLERVKVSAAILDAPVMFRAGWDRLCDHLLFIEAAREIRVSRARQRGWSEQQFEAREAAQESLAWKRDKADFVIDNSGSPLDTARQVQKIWSCISQKFPS